MLKNQKICMMRERIELTAKRLCGRVPPDRRVAVILTMLLLFGGGSIYMTVSSIYNYGKDRGIIEYFDDLRRMEELRTMPLPHPEPEPVADTTNVENLCDHEPRAGE